MSSKKTTVKRRSRSAPKDPLPSAVGKRMTMFVSEDGSMATACLGEDLRIELFVEEVQGAQTLTVRSRDGGMAVRAVACNVFNLEIERFRQ